MTELFTQILLTASYCLDLQYAIEDTFGQFNSTHYTPADTATDVYYFAFKLLPITTKQPGGQKSHFSCKNIVDIRT